MRSIEDHHLAFAWRMQVGAPEEIVRGLLFARLLEAEDRCPLWVHAAEYVPNDAVLAAGVERLQYDKKGLVAVRVKQVVQLVHAFDVFLDLELSYGSRACSRTRVLGYYSVTRPCPTLLPFRQTTLKKMDSHGGR